MYRISNTNVKGFNIIEFYRYFAKTYAQCVLYKFNLNFK